MGIEAFLGPSWAWGAAPELKTTKIWATICLNTDYSKFLVASKLSKDRLTQLQLHLEKLHFRVEKMAKLKPEAGNKSRVVSSVVLSSEGPKRNMIILPIKQRLLLCQSIFNLRLV